MKEGNTKRQSAVWVFISGGVLIAVVVIALYSPWLSFCDVRQVIVSGNHHVSAAELVSLSGLHRGQTVFSVPANAVRQRLEAVPWVKAATVRRHFPHSIELVVEERQVVAWTEDPTESNRLAIGEGGVIVGDEAAVTSSLELVGAQFSGWEVGGAVVDPQVAELLPLLQGDVCGYSVERVDVTDLRSIDLFLENDTRVRLGDITLMRAHFMALEALCREIQIDGYETIDVRFGGEATLVPRKAVRR